MDPSVFFGLRPTDEPGRWELPVTREICSGLGTLFGGSALGAAIEALELTTGRPLLWASTQFVSHAKPPSTVALTVTTPAVGHRLTQARAVGHVEGEEIFAVNAALGRRPDAAEYTWVTPPAVAPPGECPPRPDHPRFEGTVIERMETRLALTLAGDRSPGDLAPGKAGFWVRVPDLAMSSAALGLIGDHVPAGVSVALGERSIGQSLDNTLRVVDLIPAPWYLVDVDVDALRHGCAHGTARIWTDSGRLCGIASQTAVVRRPPADWDQRPDGAAAER
jgi:acyl-CoA thioesterase II